MNAVDGRIDSPATVDVRGVIGAHRLAQVPPMTTTYGTWLGDSVGFIHETIMQNNNQHGSLPRWDVAEDGGRLAVRTV